MRKLGVCLALTGATVWLTGCGAQFGGQSSASQGGIAVVDLDKVAAETGKGEEMKSGLELQRNALAQVLVQARDKAAGFLEAKAKDLKEQGDDATDDAKREFNQISLNVNNNWARAQNEANARLTNFQQQQIAKFRVELKPLLHETAAKRGLSVVIPKNDGLLLTVDPGVDITDDVIKAFRAKHPTPTAAPATAAAKPAAPARLKDADRAAKDADSESRR